MSHQLIEIGFSPDHSLLKKKIVACNLLATALYEIGRLDVFWGRPVFGDDDWFIVEGGFHRAHTHAFRAGKADVAVALIVETPDHFIGQ